MPRTAAQRSMTSSSSHQRQRIVFRQPSVQAMRGQVLQCLDLGKGETPTNAAARVLQRRSALA
jgi:hypothetical protein